VGSPRLYVVQTTGTTGTTGTTIPWCVKQNTRSLVIAQFGFSLGAAAPGAGMTAQLQGVAGALPGSGSTQTPGKLGDQSLPAATATAEVGGTTIGTVAVAGPVWYVQPFGGIIDIEYPLKREPGLEGGTAGYWALQVTNLAVAYPYASYVIFEET